VGTSNLIRITVSGHNYKSHVNSIFINKITSLNFPQIITLKRLSVEYTACKERVGKEKAEAWSFQAQMKEKQKEE
jgi:hypothetical protein